MTNNDYYAERLRFFRNLCFQKEQRFLHDEIGHNYRFTNIQAAIGLAQLEQIERFIYRKREMARRYNEELAGLPLELPVERYWSKNVYWMYGVVVDESAGLDAGQLAVRLTEEGVQTRPFFIGIHQQPVLKRIGLFRDISLPVTERIARQGLYLPSGQGITDEQIAEVIEKLRFILK